MRGPPPPPPRAQRPVLLLHGFPRPRVPPSPYRLCGMMAGGMVVALCGLCLGWPHVRGAHLALVVSGDGVAIAAMVRMLYRMAEYRRFLKR